MIYWLFGIWCIVDVLLWGVIVVRQRRDLEQAQDTISTLRATAVGAFQAHAELVSLTTGEPGAPKPVDLAPTPLDPAPVGSHGAAPGEPHECPECHHFAAGPYPWYDGAGKCCHCGTPAAHLKEGFA